MDFEQWENQGKPEIWEQVLAVVDDGHAIEVWVDRAYGMIKLIVDGVYEVGRDHARVGEYTVLGAYYGVLASLQKTIAEKYYE